MPSRRSSFENFSGPNMRAAPPVTCANDIHTHASPVYRCCGKALAEPREVALAFAVAEERVGAFDAVERDREPPGGRPPALEPVAMPLRYAVSLTFPGITGEC
jgi:hypothetical protein